MLEIRGVYERNRYMDPAKLHDAIIKGYIDLDILINTIQ